MKHVISVDKSNPDKALSLIKDDFLDNIKNIVLEHQQWHKDRKMESIYIYMYTHMCVCMYIYVCTYMCIYVYVYIYMHVCIYIF
ncbi:hypothetical protein P7K49_018164 [Saguinus oedipus]|uniref:Uncharacterized protein n=1 Tax=Saguinus oedipus TaxID=9490 RepID=A0ABQ9V4L7_SAGOE|nr:hypothetical protein P7K49_018164 [Saguinus oedipus]